MLLFNLIQQFYIHNIILVFLKVDHESALNSGGKKVIFLYKQNHDSDKESLNLNESYQ